MIHPPGSICSGLIFSSPETVGVPGILLSWADPEGPAALSRQAFQLRTTGELHTHHDANAVDGLSGIEVISVGKQLDLNLPLPSRAVYTLSGAA